MIANIYLIHTPSDDEKLSSVLLEARPSLVFVNGIRWPSPDPPLIPSIAAGTSRRVLLWDRAVYPDLPFVPNSDGSVTGPSTKYVISFDRSTLTLDGNGREALVSGALMWSAAVAGVAAQEFYRQVFKLARRCAPVKMRTTEGGLAKGFRAGTGAASWWAEKPSERVFGLNAAGVSAVPIL
jgi:hypothetical protein